MYLGVEAIIQKVIKNDIGLKSDAKHQRHLGIEGLWIERVITSDSNMNYSIIEIGFNKTKQRYYITGDNFDYQGNYNRKFFAQRVFIEKVEDTLIYTYLANIQDADKTQAKGIGIVEFEDRGNEEIYTEAAGFFADRDKKLPTQKFNWRRIDDGEIHIFTGGKNKLKRMKEKREFVKKYHRFLANREGVEEYGIELPINISNNFVKKLEDFVKKQRKLLSQNDIEVVIDNLVDLLEEPNTPSFKKSINSVLILSARYRRVIKEKNLGTSDDINEELNKITSSIIYLLDELESLGKKR